MNRGMHFFILLMLMVLGGCTSVKSSVTRFNSLPSDMAGGSFYIFTQDKQKGSAEFAHYARSISARLKKLGFRETNEITNADLVALLNYGLGASTQVSGLVPIYGPTGGGSTYHSGSASAYGTGGSAYGTYSGTSYTAPAYGVTGYSSYSRTENNRYFSFQLIDNRRSTKDNLIPVYEAKVASSGSSANFGEIADCIFDAVFDDFYKTGSDTVSKNMKTCGVKP